MKRYFIVAVLSCLVAFGVTLHVQQVVQAAAPSARTANTIPVESTVLQMQPVADQPLAKQFPVTAVLKKSNGQPLVDESVVFLVGGLYQGQARTDLNGQAVVTITTDFAAGNYQIKALFQGTQQYAPSSGTTSLVIQPSVFQVQTVPALAGINFQLGDKTFTSGADGYARVSVDRPGDYTLQVLPSNKPGSNQQIEFIRWMDDVFVSYRDVKIPTDKPLQVGFQVNYKVGQQFVDLQNKSVKVSRITSLTLKSSQGTYYTFNDGQMRWLPSSLVTRRVGGLTVVPIQYSVMSVVVDGSNVVSQAQQRFYCHPGDVWQIQLLLFSATVSAHDAFLGFPVGTGVILQYPDGTRTQMDFNRRHSVTVSSLARGIYHVQVTGVQGLTPSTPVALSQDQVMKLKVLTSLDIFLAVALGTALAISLIIIGRTQILNKRRLKRAEETALPRRVPGISGARDQ